MQGKCLDPCDISQAPEKIFKTAKKDIMCNSFILEQNTINN